MRSRYLAFFQKLPLALEGPDLRVVHACWHEEAVDRLRIAGSADTAALFDRFETESEVELKANGILARAEQEKEAYRKPMRDPDYPMPMLPALAAVNEAHQMANPIRVLTSGVERVGKAPFYSSGRWRMVERVAWWNEYDNPIPTVMGHYWRWPVPVDRTAFGKGGPDLFDGMPFDHGLGAQANVYCIDYSVGRRFQERIKGAGFQTRLAALRWPERELVFDGL